MLIYSALYHDNEIIDALLTGHDSRAWIRTHDQSRRYFAICLPIQLNGTR